MNVYFKNWFISKNFSVKKFSANTHGRDVAAQTLRWPCEPNITFYWSDISRIQLKSNRAVGERLLYSDNEVVREWNFNLNKRKWTFLQCLISKMIHLEKNSVMEPLAYIRGTQGSPQTVRWPSQPIICLIEHLEGPTEVPLNISWQTVGLWSISVW